MANYLDYARRDGERPERWPNLKEAAAKPWMGQTAVIGRRPWLVVGFDGTMYELENERGERMRVNQFEVLDYESDNNRLVAASRVEGSPLDVGYRLSSCGCAVGPLNFDRESYEWSALTDEGGVIDIEARINELEDADWKVAETLAYEADPVGHDLDPDLAPGAAVCPDCGSDQIGYGDDVAYCEDCGWHGDWSEVRDENNSRFDDDDHHFPHHHQDDDWQYSSVSHELDGAPERVNEIYSRLMNEGQGRGDTPEEKAASCEALAWATHKKIQKIEDDERFEALQGRVAKIVREGDKYCVKSEDGSKNLGCEDSMEAAKKRLREVEYFKHRGNVAMEDVFGMVKEAPGDKHLPYATPKRNRQYEHILENCKKEHPDYSLDRCKELAAATTNKERREKGETKDSADGGGISDRLDNPKDGPLKCPKCDSHTVGLVNSENSEFGCKACGHRFKHDVIKNPKAPKEKKGSYEIMDSDGRPLASGHYYNLHGDKYKIPDIIKILDLNDGHITATVEDNSTPLKISAEDIESQGYSFEPLPITSHIEKHDIREAVSWADNPDPEAPRPLRGGPRNNEDLMNVPQNMGNEYTLPTPSGGTLWVRENANGEVTGWSVPSFDGQPGQWSTRDLERVQAQVDQARVQAVAKTARRAFTPGEQKKLIDEKGNARNRDKLRLDDSHYTEAKIEDDPDFLF